MGINIFLSQEKRKCIICGIRTARCDTRFCSVHLSMYPREQRKKIIWKYLFGFGKRKIQKPQYELVYDLSEYKFNCDKKRAKKSHILVKDENNTIIGYYSPLAILDK